MLCGFYHNLKIYILSGVVSAMKKIRLVQSSTFNWEINDETEPASWGFGKRAFHAEGHRWEEIRLESGRRPEKSICEERVVEGEHEAGDHWEHGCISNVCKQVQVCSQGWLSRSGLPCHEREHNEARRARSPRQGCHGYWISQEAQRRQMPIQKDCVPQLH